MKNSEVTEILRCLTELKTNNEISKIWLKGSYDEAEMKKAYIAFCKSIDDKLMRIEEIASRSGRYIEPGIKDFSMEGYQYYSFDEIEEIKTMYQLFEENNTEENLQKYLAAVRVDTLAQANKIYEQAVQ